MWEYNYTDELYHHGVKGMKWGVRRAEKKAARQAARRQAKVDSYTSKMQNFTGKQAAREAKLRDKVAAIGEKRDYNHISVGKRVVQGALGTMGVKAAGSIAKIALNASNLRGENYINALGAIKVTEILGTAGVVTGTVIRARNAAKYNNRVDYVKNQKEKENSRTRNS